MRGTKVKRLRKRCAIHWARFPHKRDVSYLRFWRYFKKAYA